VTKRRINQFNLMLTEEELALLHRNAENRGYVNKSQYLRELLKNDSHGDCTDYEQRITWEQIDNRNRKYMRRCLLWIVASTVVLFIMTILIYIKLSS